MLKNPFDKRIILASASPRRQSLLRDMGLVFDIKIKELPENHPPHLKGKDVAIYLAELKANAFRTDELTDNTIVIAADTIVCLNNVILGKPKNFEEAFHTLNQLSGKKHEVITGVCLRSVEKKTSFCAHTDVYFKELSSNEIHYYIENFKPYDKAGAYGIQEWIGYIGIKRINGSFYNVMGLPVQQLYEELVKF